MKVYDSKEFWKEQLVIKNQVEISEELGIGTSTIQRKLHQFNLTSPTAPWTKKEIEMLKENYDKVEDIHMLFPNRTKYSVYHKAHRMNLVRPWRRRYHKVDEKFFRKWTKESSYVLGWMLSDGNVSKDRRTFGFHLNKKDIKILKKIKKAFKSNHKIFVRGDYVEFKVHSKKMCRDLISLGCMPKKTLKIRFPEKMPKKYLSHFVRGYFDGDGSIHFNYPNVIKISIVGNRKFVDGLRKKVSQIVETKTPKTSCKESNLWRIEFYGDKARKFCKWMYKDCGNLYLERKFVRFKNHLKKREGV
jgi:hypothetical protein